MQQCLQIVFKILKHFIEKHIYFELKQAKMPTSLKQLDQRYQSVCCKIADAKDYTIQHLTSNIEIDVDSFFKNLGVVAIEDCEDYLRTVEETIQQCKVAVKSEKSRRDLAYEIQRKTEETQ